MSSSTSSEAATKLKKRHIKSRSGCTTCKIRKVKCDEAKPSCFRCLKFGAECGYDGHSTVSTLNHPKLAPPIIPGYEESTTVKLAALRPLYPRLSQSEVNPSISLQGSIEDRQYFNLFRENVAFTICKFYSINSDFWVNFLSQLCHSEGIIRHEILAITAMFRSKFLTGSAWKEDRTYAFSEQLKAFEMLRARRLSGSDNLRFAVLSSLIVGLFEIVHGNWGNGLQQLLRGRALLKVVVARTGSTQNSLSIDPEITWALDHLELETVSYLVLNPIQEIPLTDEYDYEILINGTDDHLEVSSSTLTATIKTLILKFIGRCTQHRTPDGKIIPTESLLAEKAKLEQLWERHNRSYVGPLQQNLASSGSIDVSHLKSQLSSHTFDILLATSLASEELAHDAYLSTFRFIVQTSWLRKDLKQVNYHDSAWVLSIFYAATRCRDFEVRSKAIFLLLYRSLKAGVLGQTGKIAEWVADLEHEGRDEHGFIPEQSRVRMHSLKWIVTGNLINAECMLGTSGLDCRNAVFTS